MTWQPVSSIFLCSPLPFRTLQTPGLSITWCCLSTSSSVCLVFFPFALCLARWFWPDLMNGRHVHTTAVCVLYDGQEVFVWPDCLLDLDKDFPVGNMVFVLDVQYLAEAPHFQGSYSSLQLCCEGPWFTSIQDHYFYFSIFTQLSDFETFPIVTYFNSFFKAT